MQIIGNSFEEFHFWASKKSVIAFGASDFLKLISLNYKELNLDRYIECVADGNKAKQGESITINGCQKPIVSPEKILEFEEDSIVILITSDVYAYEIYLQLEELLGDKDIKVFVLSLMISKHVDDAVNTKLLFGPTDIKTKIPKTIHYFWFSKEPKNELAIKCIESWKRTCPDYEIKEWNGDNFDVTVNSFAHEAFIQKKWAYVSDYARLDIVYKYGGIYLDLDVVLYKNLDVLLHNDFFVGFGPIRDIEAAIFGAIPRCPIVGEMRDIYKERIFDPNRSTTLLNLQPILLDRFFEEKGFEINGRYQEKDGITIYPRELFSAKNWFTGEYELTTNALGIHECAGGWVGKNGRSAKQIRMEGNQSLERKYELGK